MLFDFKFLKNVNKTDNTAAGKHWILQMTVDLVQSTCLNFRTENKKMCYVGKEVLSVFQLENKSYAFHQI